MGKTTRWWELDRTPKSIWIGFYQQPTKWVRDRLAEQNYGLVYKVANRMVKKCAASREQLEAAGAMGLVKAIDKFDPSCGNAFSSHAVPWIRGEILHWLRDNSSEYKVPRQWREFYCTVRSIKGELEALGRKVTHTEVAVALRPDDENIAAEWQDIVQATRYLPCLSVEEMPRELEDERSVTTNANPYPALMKLPRLQRDLIQAHVMDGQSLDELAYQHEMDADELQKLIDQGLEAMRAELEDSYNA